MSVFLSGIQAYDMVTLRIVQKYRMTYDHNIIQYRSTRCHREFIGERRVFHSSRMI